MNNHKVKTYLLLVLMLCLFHIAKAQTSFNIKTVTGFPSEEAGYGLGVSACYAGMIGNRIIMAGGCNFPENGKKKYYAGIYAAKVSDKSLDWKLIGYLPEPAAYGGVVTLGDSLILIGGNNNEHSLKTVLSIRLNKKKDKAIIKLLPSLPYTVDNMAVTQLANHIYIFGGNQDGKASASLLHWDVSKKQDWEYLSEIPECPRVQPVCVADKGKLYIWGGFFANGLQSTVATNGYSYDIASKVWKQLDAPKDTKDKELTLTGATAILTNQSILCLGGVNKDIFWDAISGSYQLVKKEDYLQKDIDWYQFNGNLLFFNPIKEKWNAYPQYDKRLSRAGAQLVKWGNKYFYIGGELKPGVRTPEILLIFP